MKGAIWVRVEQISRSTVAEVSQSGMRLDESEQSHAPETMPGDICRRALCPRKR